MWQALPIRVSRRIGLGLQTPNKTSFTLHRILMLNSRLVEKLVSSFLPISHPPLPSHIHSTQDPKSMEKFIINF